MAPRSPLRRFQYQLRLQCGVKKLTHGEKVTYERRSPWQAPTRLGCTCLPTVCTYWPTGYTDLQYMHVYICTAYCKMHSGETYLTTCVRIAGSRHKLAPALTNRISHFSGVDPPPGSSFVACTNERRGCRPAIFSPVVDSSSPHGKWSIAGKLLVILCALCPAIHPRWSRDTCRSSWKRTPYNG